MSADLGSQIESRIHIVRGQRVMVDVDLAGLYGVPTKRLNEQVKRNRDRFPSDFLFQLTQDEKAEVVANCDHLRPLRYPSALPYAFTENGAVMAIDELNSRGLSIGGSFSPQEPRRQLSIHRKTSRLRWMIRVSLSSEYRSLEPRSSASRTSKMR